MHTTSQKKSNKLPQGSKQSQTRAPRKHDHEIPIARQSPVWMEFEAGIYQNEQLRARVARSLGRFGLSDSTLMVEDALDFLVHTTLGAVAAWFNKTGSVGFNTLTLSNAVYSFATRKHQRVFRTALPIREDESDRDFETAGTIPASHIQDHDTTHPDEAAARVDAMRAIAAIVPPEKHALLEILLCLRESGTSTLVEQYAAARRLARATIYDQLRKLALSIQAHPMFDAITAEFRAQFTTN